MSAAADQLRGFFKRIAQLQPKGESDFLANVEKVLLERDQLLAACVELDGVLQIIVEAPALERMLVNVRAAVKQAEAR